MWKGEETVLFSGDAVTSAVVRIRGSSLGGVGGRHGEVGAANVCQRLPSPAYTTRSNELGGTKEHRVEEQLVSTCRSWLLLPQPYDPGPKRYPMIVDVHGGPAKV